MFLEFLSASSKIQNFGFWKLDRNFGIWILRVRYVQNPKLWILEIGSEFRNLDFARTLFRYPYRVIFGISVGGNIHGPSNHTSGNVYQRWVSSTYATVNIKLHDIVYIYSYILHVYVRMGHHALLWSKKCLKVCHFCASWRSVSEQNKLVNNIVLGHLILPSSSVNAT